MVAKLLPMIREYAAGALLIEPQQVLWPTQEDAPQNQPHHALRMGFRIDQAQRRTPGTAKQHPFVDAQELTDCFHIRDQCLGVVLPQFGMGRGATFSPLVENNDAIGIRIKVAPTGAIGSATRASMNEEHGYTLGVAGL